MVAYNEVEFVLAAEVVVTTQVNNVSDIEYMFQFQFSLKIKMRF